MSQTMDATMVMESALQYWFHHHHLLEEAMEHLTGPHPTFQRMEFLGDGALSFAFRKFFYSNYPNLGPGQLTTVCSSNLTNERLARVAVKNRLYRLMRKKSLHRDKQVEEFTRSMESEREREMYEITSNESTIRAPKVLADLVESLAAAIIIDCDFDFETFWPVIHRLFDPILMSEDLDDKSVKDLLKYCSENGKLVEFVIDKCGGTTTTVVLVDEDHCATALASDPLISKIKAAKAAMDDMSIVRG